MLRLRTGTICAMLILGSLAQELIVIGPNYFTSNENYTVTIFNMKKSRVTLEASIKIGDVILAKPKYVNVKANDLQKVILQIPNIANIASAKLSIKGVNNSTKEHVVELGYRKKSISGLIQLSKPVYKPGDSVQFRVVVLDPELKPPSGLSMMKVIVEDSQGNNIREWRNVQLYYGVFEGRLDIATSPLLGTYNILVEANNEELVSKPFEVKEYVLSSFDVNVYPTVTPLEEHQALNLTIEANYYFGKPVVGIAKFELHDKEGDLELSKEMDVNGMAQVHLPFADDFNIEDDVPKKDVNVVVTFTEQSTNRTVIKDFPITVYKHPVELGNEPTEIKKDEQRFGTYISVRMNSKDQTKIKLQVKGSHKIQFLLYYVLSKGNIVDAKHSSPNKKETEVSVSINVVRSMLPRAKIIVVTVINGALLHDSVDIEYDELPNHFNLTISDDVVSPGSQIELQITGPPKAYVALTSYDQSLLQHGSGHDSVREDVWNLLDQLDRNNLHTLDCFRRMGLFSVPESNNRICEANDKSSRQGNSFNPFEDNTEFKWRTNFHENWLWRNETILRTAKTKLITTVPDTITSWYLTGFSIDSVHGLGIIKTPLQFTTLRQFYIVDNLPYSVRRGEAILLQFTLFSKLGTKTTCDVKLHNVINQMEFIGHRRNDTYYAKAVVVPPNVGVPVSFLVKPKTLGELIVRVTAKLTMGVDRDAIEKVIRVLPENLEQTHVITRYIASNVSGEQPFEIPVVIPSKADSESVRIEFSIVPNILTIVIPNLRNLLSVPTGCGEQNMVRFVPNVVVLDFLNATERNVDSTNTNATEWLQTGYQNQLKYRKSDGSFALWPHSKSSVFLTAFVGKSLHIASKYITVEGTIKSKAFDWLATQQQRNGQFTEVGYIFHKNMQGGLHDGIALTSYVMIAFLEYKSPNTSYNAVIEKGMTYIAKHIENITDPYDLSIATYAMWLNNHAKKTIALNKLKNSPSIVKEGNLQYWSRESSQIETTAYALLSLLEAGDDNNSLPTARWLFNQTYETGSFPRTQDTFVGLKALGMFSKRDVPTGNEYVVKLKTPRLNKEFKVTSSIRGSSHDIPNTERKLKFEVTSKDSGLLRVTYKYLLNLENFSHRFNITVNKTLLVTESALKLDICSNFIPRNPGELSNMALVEVTLPSGYVADPETNSQLKSTSRIQNVEYLHGGTMVVVYYNNMGKERNCFTITAYMRFKVALRRSAYVKVHDYYNPELKAIHVYDIHKTEICDICSEGDCDC